MASNHLNAKKGISMVYPWSVPVTLLGVYHVRLNDGWPALCAINSQYLYTLPFKSLASIYGKTQSSASIGFRGQAKFKLCRQCENEMSSRCIMLQHFYIDYLTVVCGNLIIRRLSETWEGLPLVTFTILISGDKASRNH